MTGIQVVSLDMFQTLVDLDTVTTPFWRSALANASLLEEEALRHDQGMLGLFFRHWAEHKDAPEFHLMRTVYEKTFQVYAEQAGLTWDHRTLVDSLFGWHRQAETYPDTIPFLNRLRASGLSACMVSDADDAMLSENLLGAYPEIRVFTSEGHRTYKNDRWNGMFHQVLGHYGVDPQAIVHIGDSLSDVSGAKRAGIRAIWLNRNGRTWQHEDVVPDAEVHSLLEAADLLWGEKSG